MKLKKLVITFSLLVPFLFFLQPNLSAKGNFEFGFHYSQWSVNILKSLVERELGNALEDNFKDTFLDEIQQDYPNMLDTSYSQSVSFDSGGDNYGFEIRWYPGGHKGSFSMGLSVEKTSLKVAFPEISASLNLQDSITGQTASFSGGVTNVEFSIVNALSFHFHFRLDIFPRAIIHPYITFGVGAAFSDTLGSASYSYTWIGDLDIPGEPTEHFEESKTQTIQELKDELEADGEEFPIPDFFFKVFPFIQYSLGLKAMLMKNLHILVDVGIWNGFLLRGGIAIRL